MSQKKHPSLLGYQPLKISPSTAPAASRIPRNFLLALLIGMIFGFSFAYLLISVSNWDNYFLYFNKGNLHNDIHHDHDLDPHSHDQLEKESGPKGEVSLHGHDEMFHKG